LHITSMAGTWMSVVKGFGGMRVRKGELYLDPFIPGNWKSYTFKIGFKGALLDIRVAKGDISVTNLSDKPVEIYIHGERKVLESAMMA